MNTNKDKGSSVEGVEQNKPEHQVATSGDVITDRIDYIAGAWLQYTLSELGSWVSLLHKRAFHRTDQKKRAKDLFDASQYLRMMTAHIESAKENSSDECKEELQRLKSQKR